MLEKVFFIGAVLLLVLSGCSHNQDSEDKDNYSAEVSVMTLKKQNIDAPMEFTATSVANKQVQIRARIEGYLLSKNYREGSYVQSGEILFTIDPQPFLLAVTSAEAALEGEIAKEENAVQNLKRVQNLFEQKASGQQELDTAIAAKRTQSALVSEAKAALAQAKLNLSYATIRSPISGWSDKVIQHEGSYIVPTQNGLLTTIYQSNPIYVDFSVDAISMEKIKKSINSSDNTLLIDIILPNGYLHPSKAKISFLSPTVDSLSGTRTVRAELSNPNGELVPGEFVKVRIKARMDNTLLIPHKALMQGAKGTYVYVIGKKNIAESRSVKVGEWVEHNVVILEGLKEGEQIVCEGNSRVEAGKAVKIDSAKKVQ
ncbi:MAG: efflux RND transporter periplasmic adaptor subunit [Sulfurimonas sp.]|uniref:efflux RND transporter periplasmic adaptor subunit n=1 Tax=Sulfurimonas sp. TaxID=2022749 RepID=UPI002607C668|nr:efflux RND transporter periplasmic adaptor subunit [Sulfurimonas sp.]MDD5372203.1 efflux RND transporter periplasmic adaptor subunit [Sulfurimonas sp.]